MIGHDHMTCLKCGGDFKVIKVAARKTGKEGFALQCSKCEDIDFDGLKYLIMED